MFWEPSPRIASTGMSIASTYHGVPLLCQVSASGRCKFKILRMAPKSLPCGLVSGKSLM
jgi:hypothetical protein